MSKIHSHYDNLKVARDAPPEVIRAAYRSLSHKYHPDRNSGNAEAGQVMAMINSAYDVLSDPAKRKEHDAWIAAAEARNAGVQKAPDNTSSSSRGRAFTIDESKLRPRPAPPQSTAYKTGRMFAHVMRNWLWYGIGALVILSWVNDDPKSPSPGPKPYIATPAPSGSNDFDFNSLRTAPAAEPQKFDTGAARAGYVRPATAPNGRPWPISAAYIRGYQRLHTNGFSTVTIDNAQNDSDVFVKLVSLDGPQAYPVRQFFIPAFSSFTLKKVTAGSYDIRYRDLSSGGLSRSEAFNLKETPTYNGTQFSSMTMTLYKVQNGNMQTHELSETEF